MEKKFKLNFGKAVSQFEQALKRFQVRKIIYKSAFRGKGLEFDSYRDFSPDDDDASLIDWKASLRANKLLAKSYIEERDLNIYFVVDVSNSMMFGSGGRLKAEYVAEIIAALSYLIVNSGDNIGLIMFNEKITKFIKPGKSKNQFPMIIKYLSDIPAYGGSIDMKKVFNEILERVNTYSVLILLSDFLHLHANAGRELNLLSKKFEVMAMMIHDPLDESLPSKDYQVVVEDPYSGRQMLMDPSIASEVYRQSAIKQKNNAKKLFEKSGIDLLELNTSRSFVIPVISFLKYRAGGITRI